MITDDRSLKPLRILLLPFSWVFGLCVWIRNALYDAGLLKMHDVGVPVISVGNLSVGGTGKTPVVEMVVGYLSQKGKKVAVVSRGYKRATKGTVVVSDGNSLLADVSSSGDEPFQIARKLPSVIVVVDEDRVRGARAASAGYGADVIVLDDGFQHRRLRRSLDLVLIDDSEARHAQRLLPAGRRREPMSSLRRADGVIVAGWNRQNGSDPLTHIARFTKADVFTVEFAAIGFVRMNDGLRQPVAELKGKSCLAFCGIARPERFRATLEGLQLAVKEFVAFRDHHWYGPEDIADLRSKVDRLNPDIVVTTEKDAARLTKCSSDEILQSLPIYYLELQAKVTDRSAFLSLIDRAVS